MTEKRKDLLDELLAELDEHCQFILAGIIKHPEGIGFNQLYKEIRKQNNYNKMAKTTLSEHLKHLVAKNLIKNEIDEKSPLKFKPSNYHTSSYFRKLSKGFVAQSATPEDFLPLMMSEDAKTVTEHLLSVIISHVSDCLVSVLQAPENISRLNMFQLFYNMETLMKAYQKRITSTKEVPFAINVIEECKAKTTKSL